MEKMILVLMIMLGTPLGHAMANPFSEFSLPSWQTMSGALPPAAYWPGIIAGTMAILGLDAVVRGELASVSGSIMSAYMKPYELARALYLLRQFMVIKDYTIGDLLHPSVRGEFYSYLNNKGLGMVAASGYYFYFPLVLLLGGHLYHTYR